MQAKVISVTKGILSKFIIKKAVSISLLSIFSLGLFYVLFSPLLIASTSKSSMGEPVQSYTSEDGLIVSFFSYPFSYPEIALAAGSATTTVGVTVSKEAAVSAPGTLTLSPNIPGVSGSPANYPSSGTASFVVQSSSQVGFSMTLYASTNPALATGAYTFADYTPATAGSPDYTWVDPVGSPATTAFGFSVGADTAGHAAQKFKNGGGTACGGGSLNSTANCIYTFRGATNSGTAITVVNTTGNGYAVNATETIKFFAAYRDTNLNYAIPADVYQATVTATVASL